MTYGDAIVARKSRNASHSLQNHQIHLVTKKIHSYLPYVSHYFYNYCCNYYYYYY